MFFDIKRKKLKFFILWCFLFLSSCSGGSYSFRIFTFPSEIPPEEKGWIYEVRVIAAGHCGGYTTTCNKKVFINIYDANEKQLLEDRYDFKSVYEITSTATWEKVNDLEIELIELEERDGKISKRHLKTISYTITNGNQWGQSI